ncbi:hypothetical protein Tco_1451317, partial [Tanacetum coccineum]
DALKVLRYLKGSPGKGLRYFSDIQNDPLSGKVVGFIDADWAKCLVTKKFMSGTLLNKSKVQGCGRKKVVAVPTGRVVVPTGRYVVLAGKVIIIVSPGRLSLVPTGRVLSPGKRYSFLLEDLEAVPADYVPAVLISADRYRIC